MKLDHERYPKRDFIVVDGAEVPIKARVVLWTDSGLQVRVGHGARRRREEISRFVWHWSGGENDVRTLFNVLHNRELGSEWATDVEGVLWQFCDPVIVDTFDAGKANRTSGGNEIINYGFRRAPNPVPRAGMLRDTYRRTFRGSRRTFARHYPAQLNTAYALAEALGKVLPIPRCIPRELDGSIMARTMTDAEFAAYHGHMGHFHVSDRKSDPGLDLLEMFDANGY